MYIVYYIIPCIAIRKNKETLSALDWTGNLYLVPGIRGLQRSINIYNMRYYPQHVLCTSTVHDQSGDICIQGYLRILWIGNAKSFKINNIHKHYVLCLKLEYFFKVVKLNPECNKWPWDVSQKILHGTVAWRAWTL